MFAEAALLGLPVGRMLTTQDSVERGFWYAVVREAREVMDDLMSNLARKIVQEYAEARQRGEGK